MRCSAVRACCRLDGGCAARAGLIDEPDAVRERAAKRGVGVGVEGVLAGGEPRVDGPGAVDGRCESKVAAELGK